MRKPKISKKMRRWRIFLAILIIPGLMVFVLSPFMVIYSYYKLSGIPFGIIGTIFSISGTIFNLWLTNRLNIMGVKEVF